MPPVLDGILTLRQPGATQTWLASLVLCVGPNCWINASLKINIIYCIWSLLIVCGHYLIDRAYMN